MGKTHKAMKLTCMECGTSVAVKNLNDPKCPKCGSHDLDV